MLHAGAPRHEVQEALEQLLAADSKDARSSASQAIATLELMGGGHVQFLELAGARRREVAAGAFRALLCMAHDVSSERVSVQPTLAPFVECLRAQLEVGAPHLDLALDILEWWTRPWAQRGQCDPFVELVAALRAHPLKRVREQAQRVIEHWREDVNIGRSPRSPRLEQLVT